MRSSLQELTLASYFPALIGADMPAKQNYSEGEITWRSTRKRRRASAASITRMQIFDGGLRLRSVSFLDIVMSD